MSFLLGRSPHPLIVLAQVRERASLALRLLSMANRPAVLDQVEMQAIVQPRRDEGGEQIVRPFHARVGRNPAKPARDAKDMRIDRKGRRYGSQLYGIW
jgi:hypothetical protein